MLRTNLSRPQRHEKANETFLFFHYFIWFLFLVWPIEIDFKMLTKIINLKSSFLKKIPILDPVNRKGKECVNVYLTLMLDIVCIYICK